nr:alpha-galactosidase [Acholeplasmatales bacterium]
KNEKIFGYTSWYNYYQNINEDIILRDLEGLDNRFNLFQIDDGYETFVGDWLNIDSKKFPNGLKPIVDKIHSKGLKAGIWLAPFVAEEKSELFTNHKELFKKDNKGEFVKCGCNWSGFYALDLEKEETRNYIKKSLEYFKELGFDFFKLDFLYATSVVTYDGLTRAEAAFKYYSFIREILNDKLILGCGASLFSSYQNFDYLRVGPDVSLKFDDIWFMKFMHRERISTKVTIQNTIYRSIFDNQLFLNDSDVFLLRDDNIELSKEQKDSLLEINALFSSVLMTSDNLSKYDDEKNKKLSNALNLFNNAHDIKFRREKNNIIINYKINGKEIEKTYDTLRGVLNGR